ncbi:glycosyltransferase family 2 protein [Succinivibrio dextrinosolvens]|uniref:glycosyltransferase family 2 protein n=1 Tax=Succinivibrio dextrinosolvens TaxID=83771 RepID=UPI0019226209|nr:glycosyltransferase family 2 protein [Succinivibrio dextrinosolvens]
MVIENILTVYCITYNRINYLKRTIDSFLNSPIKNVNFVILDNASTDGTSELIDRYCNTHKNITHIRHKFNMGGNANICKAYELGASGDTDYFWVICDDDIFDFTNWNEVELEFANKTDLICVCDYVFPNKLNSKKNKAYQLFQMTFVPSTIVRKNIITDDIAFNMYDCILMMFPHLCIPIYAINNNKVIHVLTKPIILPGHELNEKKADASFFRGVDSFWVLDRKKYTSWILGFANVLSLLHDKKIAEEAMKVGILYKDIFGSWSHFFYFSFNSYFITKKEYLFGEIYSSLPADIKRRFTFYKTLRKLKIVLIKIQLFLELFFSIHYIKNHKKRYLIINILGLTLHV